MVKEGMVSRMHLVAGTLTLPRAAWSLWPMQSDRAKQQQKVYISLPRTSSHPVKELLRAGLHTHKNKIKACSLDNNSASFQLRPCSGPSASQDSSTYTAASLRPVWMQPASPPLVLLAALPPFTAHSLLSPASGQVFDIGIQLTPEVFSNRFPFPDCWLRS